MSIFRGALVLRAKVSVEMKSRRTSLGRAFKQHRASEAVDDAFKTMAFVGEGEANAGRPSTAKLAARRATKSEAAIRKGRHVAQSVKSMSDGEWEAVATNDKHAYCAFIAKQLKEAPTEITEQMRRRYFEATMVNPSKLDFTQVKDTYERMNSGEFIFTFYRNREKLLEHFQASHKLCQHPDCKDLDPMLRVFRSDFDLAAHLQSQHNVRHNFTMEAFTPASNSRTPAAPSRGNQVASGANSFATKITFDFVNRKQVLDLDAPVREGGGGSRGGGGRGRGRGKSQAPHMAVSSASRLPSHYEGRTDYFGPVRVPIAAGEIAIREAYGQSTSEGDEGAQMKVLNKALGEIGGFRKGSHTSRGSMGNRELSSASSASTMSAVARVDTVVHNDIEAINALPTTLAERNMLLKERLDQLLPQSSSKAAFVDACKDFLAGKLLATEHYKQLSGTFFRDESSLNAIFPLIVATMPNEHKKEALMTARRMLTCNEFQRQERANHESEESKHEREEIEQLRASRLNNLSKGGKGKQGAWGAKPPAPSRPGSTVKDGKKDRKDTSIQSFLAPSSSASASGPKGVWTTSTTRNLVGVPAPAAPSLPQPTKQRDTNEVARGESAYGAGVNPGGGWGGTALVQMRTWIPKPSQHLRQWPRGGRRAPLRQSQRVILVAATPGFAANVCL